MKPTDVKFKNKDLTEIANDLRSPDPKLVEKAAASLQQGVLKKITEILVRTLGGKADAVASGVTDAFIELWTDLREGKLNLDEIVSVEAYLFDVARKRTIDHLRKEKRWKNETPISEFPKHIRATIEEGNVRIHPAAELRFSLSQKRWDICWEHHVDGQGIGELAAKYNMAAGTVKNELSRGKKHIQKTAKVRTDKQHLNPIF